MARWVALLRGINVGGNKRVAMADLRELVEALGHDDVETLLQSGNVVFSSAERSGDALAGELTTAIADELGMDVTVLVRSGRELAEVVAANPFPDAVAEPKNLHAAFVSAAPAKAAVAAIDRSALGNDDFAVGPGVVYLRYTAGMQGSPLTKHVTEKTLGVTMTARNWNTVTKLAEMTAVTAR
jgi:uncharacterized protein (DUF1697 family)